ncbi:phosphoserine phosphatase SerB [Brevibacterium senegalense]|uniref:phosphoserine phosphatase SerB n=1 Tax=Brevibacterium senegalense TaxID=1033736 RepID=UPI0003046B58|nr:phosphoserine phosphatase SerB [Brevibacterium senegalense]
MTAQGLLVFDVDSTFIEEEVIELLAETTGRRDEVARVTERAMRGELDFAQSLRERVAVLADLPETVVEEAAAAVTLTPGAAEVVAAARADDWIVALLSGGFTAVIERVLDGVVDSTGQGSTAGLAVDEIRANTLEIVDGRLTGRVLGEIVGPREKARHLAEIAAVHGVPAQRTIAVGDGANDALMLEAAAVGVAFCAKPALREHADLVVDERDLRVVWDRARGLLD